MHRKKTHIACCFSIKVVMSTFLWCYERGVCNNKGECAWRVLVLGTKLIHCQEEKALHRDRRKNYLFAGMSGTHLQARSLIPLFRLKAYYQEEKNVTMQNWGSLQEASNACLIKFAQSTFVWHPCQQGRWFVSLWGHSIILEMSVGRVP